MYSKLILIIISFMAMFFFACRDNSMAPVNSNPAIVTLTAEETILPANGETSVQCIATDIDNDAISFQWLSAPGTVIGSGPSILWKAPEMEGHYPLVCQISDSLGGTAEAQINFSVVTNGSPIYEIVLDYFNWPDKDYLVCDSTIFYEASWPTGPDLHKDTFDHYRGVNIFSQQLPSYPFWHEEADLVPASRLNQSPYAWPMGYLEWWNAFYEDYPDAAGLAFVSKIGFNGERSQAMLYVETRHRPLNATGYYVVLEKSDDIWVITKVYGLWVS